MICTKRSGAQGSPCPRPGVPEIVDETNLHPGSDAAGDHRRSRESRLAAGLSAGAEETALHAAVKLADDGITGRQPDRSGEAEPH